MIRALTFALCCSALSAQSCTVVSDVGTSPQCITITAPHVGYGETIYTYVWPSEPGAMSYTVQAHSPSVPMPNPQQTPGKANPALTKAILCSPGFRTGPYRHVSVAEKLAVCRAYGIFKGCPGRGYEIDHLIPLELGGSDSILNLWPQPSGPGGYHAKDVVENRAHKAVCSGSVGLRDAQQSISHDWYTFGLSLQ